MADHRNNKKINALFEKEDWRGARELIEKLRKGDPEDHWLLTQLGVTWYEQRDYRRALRLFEESRRIVPDCPLTLWNLAGALDAVGQSAQAIEIYTWLIQNARTPEEDSCWESREWADSLKADCAYRLGVSFQRLGEAAKARRWYHEYVDLVAFGVEGSYSLDDVKRRLAELHRAGGNGAGESEIRNSVRSTLRASGIEPQKRSRSKPPRPSLGHLIALPGAVGDE